MSSRSKSTKKKVEEIAQLAILCTLMFVSKELMNVLPNINPMALLIIFTTLNFGWKALYPVFGFVIFETVLLGPGLWTVMYFYIWPLLIVITMIFINTKSTFIWAVIACIFGLLFGALCSLPYIYLSGIKAAVAYWIAGIPFDLIHGIANFFIVLFVLPILQKLPFKK